MENTDPIKWYVEYPNAEVPSKMARRREDDEPFVEPLEDEELEINPEWAQHLRQPLPGPGQTPNLENVYGTQEGSEWEWMNWEGGKWEKGFREEDPEDPDKAKGLPVQVAIDWPKLWPDWTSSGFERLLTGPDITQPLDQTHLNTLNGLWDKFRIINDPNYNRKLEEGGFGEVWKMHYQEKNDQGGWGRHKQGAVKFMRINQQYMDQGDDFHVTVNKFLQDIRTLQYLGDGNPNIVKMLDVFCIPDTQTGFPYSCVVMLMEFLDGDVVDFKVLLGAVIPRDISRRIMKHICRAIHYMHDRNMVHLDLKPDNILFKRARPGPKLTKDLLLREYKTMTFKLTDFGYCQAYSRESPAETTDLCGTNEYMAPEMRDMHYQVNPLPIATKPIDIYGLGATLGFCVIENQRYFDLANNFQLYDYVRPGTWKAFPMSQEICQFLTETLEPDPNLRPTIEQLIAHPLFKWMKDEPQSPYMAKRKKHQFYPPPKRHAP